MFTHSGKWDCMTTSVKDLNKWKIIYLDTKLEFKFPKKFVSPFVLQYCVYEWKTREIYTSVDLNNSLDALLLSFWFI